MHWTTIGFEREKKMLARALRDGALSHALLFSGPESIGKHMLAMDLVRTMHPDSEPGINDLDFMPIAPRTDLEETHIAIETIRDMKAWMSRSPAGDTKIAVIDDADRMTTEAANALLKILEEPPSYAYLFLVTAFPETIPPTVRSRCQRLDLRAHSDAIIANVLSELSLPARDRTLLATVADGRIGRIMAAVHDGIHTIRRDIETLTDLFGMPLAERMLEAKKLADSDFLDRAVRVWLAWARSRISSGTNAGSLAAGILDLNATISQPQFNRRLALERFMLSLPKA